MRTLFSSWDVRRLSPRLALDAALCSEVVDGKSRMGFAVDLSPTGVRLERPYRPGMARPREVELELTLPGEDDVVVAEARVRFDEVRPAPRGSALAAAGGLVRVTGLLLSCFGIRDRRLLLDYVMDRRDPFPSALPPPALSYVDDDLRFASCYARG
jgi:hypothetical protein